MSNKRRSRDRKRFVVWRRLVQAAVLIAALILLLPQTQHTGLAYLVSASSPWIMVCGTVATRLIGWVAVPGLVVACLIMLRHRWFCRWMCPTGLLADAATWLGRKTGRRRPALARIGQWLAVLTFAGAWIGYPVFLWLDPLALLSSTLGMTAGVAAMAAWLAASGLLLVLASSAVWPGVWCHRVCPLGATQDMVFVLRRKTFSTILKRDRPVAAIAGPGMSRRLVLGSALGVAWGLVARRVIARSPSSIRPPGALSESKFVGVCVRCGNCTRACPTQIIRPDLAPTGIAGLLAPVVVFADDYCREDCTRCMDVCPSGALQPVPADRKIMAPMGIARVDMDVCLLAEDRECSACRNHCPYEAITYVWSDVDYMLRPHVDKDRCPGCGACQVACPTKPTKAIIVVPHAFHSIGPVESRIAEDVGPLHRVAKLFRS